LAGPLGLGPHKANREEDSVDDIRDYFPPGFTGWKRFNKSKEGFERVIARRKADGIGPEIYRELMPDLYVPAVTFELPRRKTRALKAD